MSNLEIREFSQAITNFVEASPLPEEVKRMALQENLARQEQKAREGLVGADTFFGPSGAPWSPTPQILRAFVRVWRAQP